MRRSVSLPPERVNTVCTVAKPSRTTVEFVTEQQVVGGRRRMDDDEIGALPAMTDHPQHRDDWGDPTAGGGGEQDLPAADRAARTRRAGRQTDDGSGCRPLDQVRRQEAPRASPDRDRSSCQPARCPAPRSANTSATSSGRPPAPRYRRTGRRRSRRRNPQPGLMDGG